MLYVHDIWVNWFEEDNPYLVPYFHEWRKEEKAELFDTLPIIIVNENMYDYIEFGSNKLAVDIQNKIHNKAAILTNKKKEKIKYAFICSDKRRIIAIEADVEGRVLKKSWLIPRQHQLVFEMSEYQEFEFELSEGIDTSHHERYAGLTRAEKESLLKEKEALQQVLEFIEELNENKKELLKYLISEWDLNIHNTLKKLDFEDIKKCFKEVLVNCEGGKVDIFNKVINKVKQFN